MPLNDDVATYFIKKSEQTTVSSQWLQIFELNWTAWLESAKCFVISTSIMKTEFIICFFI